MARMDIMVDIVEARLTQPVWAVYCTLVREDGSEEPTAVKAYTMRGVQREITAKMADAGYEPLGRWVTSSSTECARRFRLA